MTVITGRQIRAARAMLGWGQRELCRKARVALGTLQRMEGFDGPVAARTETLARVVLALERGGVEFIDNDRPGVRMPAGVPQAKKKSQ